MLKDTYKDSTNKKKVRNELLNNIKLKRIIGLAGPDINDYISSYKKKGFKVIKSYENNKSVFINQIQQSPKTSLIFGDINVITPKDNIFYDFDYCCSINSVNLDLLKSTNNYIVTFALRPLGLQYTINTFNQYCRVDNADYIFKSYGDGGTPMLNILKITKN